MSAVSIVLSLLVGGPLGGIFFGGLWLTVRRLPHSKHPELLVLASFWIRSVIAVAGLVLLMKEGVRFGLTATAGFILARLVVKFAVEDRRPATRCT